MFVCPCKIWVGGRFRIECNLLKVKPLMPFDGSSHTDVHAALPFTQEDYLELVDTTGRALRDDKRGAISHKVAAIVARVRIDPHKWLDHLQRFGLTYGYCAGSVDNILDFSAHFERKWAKGGSGWWSFR